MSSPRINLLIALGCALSYSVIILGAIPGINENWLCSVRVWALVAGYTFAFGSMFSKTWRVHVLFTQKNQGIKKVVKDYHLMLLVAACFAIDSIILVLWQIIDPLGWTKILLPSREDGIKAILYQPFVNVCTSQYGIYWTSVFYGYKALLLVFGIFFAWETRGVRVEALNDSKQIGLCVYNVMIMSVICVPLVHLLSAGQVDISYGVVSICILVCVTATLALVFGLKMYSIFKHGTKVDSTVSLPFAAALRGSHNSTSSGSGGSGIGGPRSISIATTSGQNRLTVSFSGSNK